MVQILIFGDSITYGAWDIEGGWVQRLRKYLDKKVINSNYEEYYITYNLGISGDISGDIIKRFKKETEDRLNDKEHNESVIFIFAIGTNDCLFINKTKKLNCSKEKYQKNLIKLISLAKNYSNKIVFLGLTPVDESKLNPLPWASEYSANNKYVKEFNETIKYVTNKYKINFIPIYDILIKEDYKILLADGDHPNSKGHEIIFNIIMDDIIKNKLLD